MAVYSKGLSAWISVSLRPREECSRESSDVNWSIHATVVVVGLVGVVGVVMLITPCQVALKTCLWTQLLFLHVATQTHLLNRVSVLIHPPLHGSLSRSFYTVIMS